MGSVKTFSISSYQNKRAPKIGYDGPVPFFWRENSEKKKDNGWEFTKQVVVHRSL